MSRTARKAPLRDVGKVLGRQPWALLEPHLVKAGADVTVVMPRIKRFVELLLEWNRGFSNLISTADEPRVVQRHILESLEPAYLLKEIGARNWLDFGSGGGLPAIPLVLAGVGEHWTLVESRRNKTLFLRKVLQELEINNVTVELGRLEVLVGDPEHPLRFDGFSSRATMRLGPTLSLAGNCVTAGGHACLWKGSRMEQEMKEDREWARVWDEDGIIRLGSGQTVVAKFIRRTT